MASTFRPLNAALYDALRSHFRHVRIANPGEQLLISSYNTVHLPDGRRILSATYLQWGELYVVNCPNCNDTRFRCRISHAFGTKCSVMNRRRLNLIFCHNEGCFESGDAQWELCKQLFDNFAERPPPRKPRRRHDAKDVPLTPASVADASRRARRE